MITMFQNPEFWATYWLIGAMSTGITFFLVGLHQWYKDWNDYDFPRAFIRIVATAAMSAIWPITIIGYVTLLVQMALTRLVATKKKPADTIRCGVCTAAIDIGFTFCPLCGHDQTEKK
jgi:hypothetical protein